MGGGDLDIARTADREPDGSGRGRGVFLAEGLSKSFRRRKVVDGVGLSVRAGEVVGLLGPNGAGKTTIFYMVIGLIRPEAGRVLLNGEDITDLPMYMRARKGIGYLPQESSVFRKLTVEENIMAILESLPLRRSQREERLESLLSELGLSVIRNRKAYSLSGGERRRVEITRALVTDPLFIFLDEPFAGIDPIAVTDIQKIIVQLRLKGIGVIITDHNVRETLGICERAYILNQGRILESGSPEEIAKSRKARRIYLGDSFRLERAKVAGSVRERWN
ncbi:MAG: LPS export ABC transporter ATP-binding protein [Deltaproteobacteria bacterium]|nr:LPS export ABC transporter ATP-binding protein [Deltaproteobacteria bacterium]MBW2121894.1 LPS export ABC transporter ATP-binding protein [Deltaproteobacteria bacterium]